MQHVLLEGKAAYHFPALKELRKHQGQHDDGYIWLKETDTLTQETSSLSEDARFVHHMNGLLFRGRLEERAVEELVLILPREAQQHYEKQRVTRQEKSLFGLRTKDITKEEFVPQGRNRTFADLKPGGRPEPIWSVIYKVDHIGNETTHGARGSIDLHLDLPESLAREVEAMIRKDPSFIRDLLGREAQKTTEVF